MPSNAFTVLFQEALADAGELANIHEQLRTGKAGRQSGLGSLNRASVVISVSAWEAYIEELMREAVQALRPAAPPLDPWPALNAYALSLLGTFHTPSAVNVERLVRNCTGLANVHHSWTWQNCTSAQAVQRLSTAMNYRHEIAHGVTPRPVIHNDYSTSLLSFVNRLAMSTDAAVRNHLVLVLGLAHPWPP